MYKTKEEKSTFSKLCVYCCLYMLETTCFGIALRARKIDRIIGNYFTICACLVFEFIFIFDALVNKNIYQVKNYPRLSIFSVILAATTLYNATGVCLAFTIIYMCITMFDILLTIYWTRELDLEFKWYYYKKLGLSDELNEVNRLKQKIVVYFKIDFMITLTRYYWPNVNLKFTDVIKVCNILIAFFIVFFFVCYFQSENKMVRIFLIFLYVIKMVIDLLDVLLYAFNYQASLILIPISFSYSIVNDVLLIWSLIEDFNNFGKGLTKELNKNVRINRNALY